MVLPTDAGFVAKAVGALIGHVDVEDLAAAMVDLCINGSENKLWENNDLVVRGKRVLESKG